MERPDQKRGVDLLFIAGFGAVFITVSVLAATAGRVLSDHQRTLEIVGGALMIVFALALIGFVPLLQRQFPDIGDVRGLGLMTAMDLVRDRESLAPDPARRDEVVQAAFRHGLLLLGCGESAVRFCPPLCVTAEQVEVALRILAEVLAARRSEKLAV